MSWPAIGILAFLVMVVVIQWGKICSLEDENE